MSNPNKIHYPRGYTSVAGIQFNPKMVVGAILVVFSLYAVYKYGQFAAEKNFNMSVDSTRGTPKVEHLSWLPRVFYHHNFLTDSEISSLQASAGNMTLGANTAFRGHGAWFENLEKRIARFTQEPVANFEGGIFNVYKSGKENEPRRDWFNKDESELQGPRGNRVATFIMFLTPASGAEIVLPKANLKVTPRVGDAILIWNVTPDHKIDELTYYGFQKVSTDILTYTMFIRERS